jgi:hypothetical protein
METDVKKDFFLTRHLRCAGEGYFEHLLFTLRIGSLLFVAALVVIIHGLLPFILVSTGSSMIGHINTLLTERRARQKTAPAE